MHTEHKSGLMDFDLNPEADEQLEMIYRTKYTKIALLSRI